TVPQDSDFFSVWIPDGTVSSSIPLSCRRISRISYIYNRSADDLPVRVYLLSVLRSVRPCRREKPSGLCRHREIYGSSLLSRKQTGHSILFRRALPGYQIP